MFARLPIRALLIALIVGFAVTAPVLAQTNQAVSVPDANGVAMLIRTTLSALNDANRTGNYTVFRDLGSPAFRQTNSSARLAEIFASLRKKKLNLAPVTIIAPKLAKPASINQKGMLYLKGVFPTRPLTIDFELLYQRVGTDWRVFGIRVDTPTAAVAKARPKAKTKPRKKLN